MPLTQRRLAQVAPGRTYWRGYGMNRAPRITAARPCRVSKADLRLPHPQSNVASLWRHGQLSDYAARSPSGGARAGRASGTSGGRPRCRRMRRVTADSSRSAISRSRPPQRGHASTSKPKARRIRSAHREPDPCSVGACARAGVSRASAFPEATGVSRRTMSARHAARGASTPW